jgi:four helix bundle protein
MKKGVVQDKSFAFVVRIVELSRFLTSQNEFVISRQILKSGTAVGALIREAEHAESSNDFIHKLSIAQKECNETLYWLELLKETNFINEESFNNLSHDAKEMMKLLTSIIKKKKENLKPKA